MTGDGRGYRGGRRRPGVPDGAAQHREWLGLVEVTGPFLSLPVLRAAWPTLDPLDSDLRDRLRRAHAAWLDGPAAGQPDWVAFVLTDLLGWDDALRWADPRAGTGGGLGGGLDFLAVPVPEHDTAIVPSFALLTPGTPDGEVKPDTVACLGLVCPPGAAPTARVSGSDWAATPTDRMAHALRATGVELGLVTDGRFWALVWAPAGKSTTTAVFDAVGWADAAERHVVRAFVSLLARRRFFGVPDEQRLTALLRASLDRQEDITEALGTQVRRATELLVAALSRADARERERGGPGLSGVDAHDVYRGAVAVMMRVVFLLFAEERGLLPAGNDLYAAAYSAGGLRDRLERRAREGSEHDLEHGYAAWHRLLALFNAVYHGVDHPRLRLHAHDGSIFDPAEFGWLPLNVDDRTVLHMLRAVQVVQVGTGKNREARTLSFRSLDVDQIGYVYEGLLSFEGFRADAVMVGLIGRDGAEDEVALADLEALAATTPDLPALAAALADRHKDSGIGSPRALARRLAPPGDADAVETRRRLLAVTGGDYPLAERLAPFAGILRADLRDLPVVILPGALYVTESALRRNTGTHYTPRELA
ncbi:MAG TPA: SAM-dependent DNA methyltransferase, partial [Mycobacteriales bacterium]|nr:SAM-dependent DNA methyltransferase [Mycobacteriales bacterium]